MSDAEQTAVLIDLDLCRLLPDQVEDIRRHTAQAVGITVQCVSVAVTHTHAGPLTTRDYYPEGKVARYAYIQYVKEQAATAALRAKNGREPVFVGAGYGSSHIGTLARVRKASAIIMRP